MSNILSSEDLLSTVLSSQLEGAIPVHAIRKSDLDVWLDSVDVATRNWVTANAFDASAGKYLMIPDENGIAAVIAGVSEPVSVWDLGALPKSLPVGHYVLSGLQDADAELKLSLGWVLGAYGFSQYKDPGRPPATLAVPEGKVRDRTERLMLATYLVRDLINTPANDMGPSALAGAAERVAKAHGAEFEVTVGDALLSNNYPAIHAVGRAAADAPRLIEITWGNPENPTVALVGKGVCFDTGGLDIKPASGMLRMKKDMGGAAHVLGVAHCLMAQNAPLHLKVLIPAVENSISGNAMRPLDVVPTRAGITIEISNTDAEGRVILSDALQRAREHDPEVIVDFATLTGAARVALGTDLPALFCNNDGFCDEILAAAEGAEDPLWRMPLWAPYRKMVDGKTADINNAPEGGYAGAITAALFLERFVDPGTPWAHIDVMAWNQRPSPGRPEGGEAMGMRAIAAAIMTRFGLET